MTTLSLSSPVYHIIRGTRNGYSPLQIDGLWEGIMLALPLAAAVLCFTLFRAACKKVKRAEPSGTEAPVHSEHNDHETMGRTFSMTWIPCWQ